MVANAPHDRGLVERCKNWVLSIRSDKQKDLCNEQSITIEQKSYDDDYQILQDNTRETSQQDVIRKKPG